MEQLSLTITGGVPVGRLTVPNALRYRQLAVALAVSAQLGRRWQVANWRGRFASCNPLRNLHRVVEAEEGRLFRSLVTRR
jgi:hypothetical protein